MHKHDETEKVKVILKINTTSIFKKLIYKVVDSPTLSRIKFSYATQRLPSCSLPNAETHGVDVLQALKFSCIFIKKKEFIRISRKTYQN